MNIASGTITKTNVLIVGAGPTGLSLAAQLIRYGIDFVIVDKKPGCTDLSKALIVHARTLEIYDQIGLAEKAVDNGQLVQKVTLMHGGQVSARLNFADIGEQLSPFPFLLVFEQSKNEHLLYKHLQDHGKDVRWQSELESLTQDENGVKAVLRDAEGATESIEANYLVGCDGASSATRHLLGLGFEGSTNSRLFYVADVEMEFQATRDSLYVTFGRDSFVLMIPMEGENHWRLIGNFPEYDDQVDREVVYAEVETKVKELVQQYLDITKVRWFSTYKVHTRHAQQFSVGRCFLAGDAAHVHTPAGGQGMNTGIQDAYNLAWKLAMVLQKQASAALLETYNEERLSNAKQLLKTTDRVFDVGTGNTWYLQFFRAHILPGLAGFVTRFDVTKASLFTEVSEIGINYRESSLSHRDHGDRQFSVKPGDRMPYFQVEGRSIYDRLRAPKFHLLLFSNPEHALETFESELQPENRERVDFHSMALDRCIVEVFGVNQPFLVLLRPDHYLGLITADISIDAVESYLNTVI